MLAFRAQGANKATRRKLSLKAIKIKLMTSGKTLKKPRKTKDSLSQKSQAKLRLATVNVGSLVRTSAEVTESNGRRQVDIATLQEARYKNEV